MTMTMFEIATILMALVVTLPLYAHKIDEYIAKKLAE